MKFYFLILVLLTGLSACKFEQMVFGSLGDKVKEDKKSVTPVWSLKISQFSSCDEIESYQSYMKSLFSGDSVTVVEDMPIFYDHYRSQVDGVVEGDMLQKGSDHYFFSRPGAIEIVDRSSLKSVASLKIPEKQYHSALFFEHKLISLSSSKVSQVTSILVFDELKNFELVSQQEMPGYLVDYRYFDGNLVLVTTTSSSNVPSGVDCNTIFRPNLENGIDGITFINKIPIINLKSKPSSLALWGRTDFFYMTKNELFLFQNLQWQSQSGVRVIDWQSGALSFNQAALIDGTIKDRTAIHKQGDYLFLVSTEFENQESFLRSSLVNYLQSFKKDESGIYHWNSRSIAFGLSEDVRAVQYLNDKAFVVTFEKTDPLFVFDIKDPNQIQLISELEVPGFSTQLHELPNQLLVGVGFDALPDDGFSWFGGVKLSLFDFRDPHNLVEKSFAKFGDRGSYSEAVFDSHGLFISNEGNQVIVPIVEIAMKSEESYPGSLGTNHLFSGAVELEVRDREIFEKRRFTHQMWRESACGKDFFARLIWWQYYTPSMDIQRVSTFGNCIDTFSRFGVMRFCSNDETASKQLKFTDGETPCAL